MQITGFIDFSGNFLSNVLTESPLFLRFFILPPSSISSSVHFFLFFCLSSSRTLFFFSPYVVILSCSLSVSFLARLPDLNSCHSLHFFSFVRLLFKYVMPLMLLHGHISHIGLFSYTIPLNERRLIKSVILKDFNQHIAKHILWY